MGIRIDSFNGKNMSMCKSCINGKQHRVKFPKGPTTKATDILNMVHIDMVHLLMVNLDTLIYVLTHKFEFCKISTL
jgi:hypothetical protein